LDQKPKSKKKKTEKNNTKKKKLQVKDSEDDDDHESGFGFFGANKRDTTATHGPVCFCGCGNPYWIDQDNGHPN
jgi:hypothetical protein